MQRFLYSDGTPLSNGKVFVTIEYPLDENGLGEIPIPSGQLCSVLVKDSNGFKMMEIEGINSKNNYNSPTIPLKSF